MRKKVFTLVLTFLTEFTLFVGVQNHRVMASEVEPANELQQNRKHVDVSISLSIVPPTTYFYSSGGYAGYLGLVNYFFDGTKYHATYIGYLYDSPPYPAPAMISLDK
ncbi:hypothetical protein [Sporosarcina limicola]|uniref:Uncharacterized protein n=1 Tax=Sporosarcina limicola TaxID=34101 RepID=A0A927RFB7_9BACL|nr:hypothetical protein [Sporosarcina limicola]MBE1555362.1 hypothetical protein [Sporosarcina limicola]